MEKKLRQELDKLLKRRESDKQTIKELVFLIYKEEKEVPEYVDLEHFPYKKVLREYFGYVA